jgi:hypothetical protein
MEETTVLSTEYYWDDQIREDVMSRSFSAHEGDEYVQEFSWRTWRDEISLHGVVLNSLSIGTTLAFTVFHK